MEKLENLENVGNTDGFEMDSVRLIERGLITTYKSRIYRPFRRAVEEYCLLSDGDKVAVCISGGKDSMLLAKCLQEYQRHGDISFSLEFITMDPGYHTKNRQLIEHNAKRLGIPIHFFNTNVFDVVEKSKGSSPCFLCAKMRRGCLYGEAERLGCNKIALGHHFDDAIETMLINIFYGGEVKTMMPKLKSTSCKLELIRPLYMVKEHDIMTWRDSNQLQFLDCACKFNEKAKEDVSLSKRKEIKGLIEYFRQNSKYVDLSIFHSMTNINLDAVLGWTSQKEKHTFLENYDK